MHEPLDAVARVVHGIGERVGEPPEQARAEMCRRGVGHAMAGILCVGDERGVLEDRGAHPGQRVEAAGGELTTGCGCDGVFGLVRFVDDHHVVVGEDDAVEHEVERE